MKKIKINLHKDAARMVGEILNEIHHLPTGNLPTPMVLEILLCQEFFRAHMAKLFFPLPDKGGRNQNKFTMQPSTALALMSTIGGYDMSHWDAFSRVLRDDLVNALAAQVGHLMKNQISA